ncbi:MAG: hypothetical protein COV45_07000 [Deltaproteobacteria bacterium CG11_big_fil_rev_8_21_14_0_20_47_16]|nr:MAG: hypothetical protein COV45_07000 [Deltaproteobacteria bacterium CG11_big_fil_rev_8_21_14_0_20_47_16]
MSHKMVVLCSFIIVFGLIAGCEKGAPGHGSDESSPSQATPPPTQGSDGNQATADIQEDGMVSLKSVRAITAGGDRTCAIVDDGSLKCWGINFNGPDSEYNKVKDKVHVFYPKPTAIPGLDKVIKVSTNGATTCAIQGNGDVRCWGINPKGSTGVLGWESNYYTADPTLFKELTELEPSNLVMSSMAGALAAQAREKVYAWGPRDLLLGSLAAIGTTPKEEVFANGVVKMSLAGAASCGIFQGGKVQCWGPGRFGQFGDGKEHNISFPVPPYSPINLTDIPGVGAATDITVGAGHACAIVDKDVLCWGSVVTTATYAPAPPALADFNLSKPVIIKGLVGTPTALASGCAHTCVLMESGAVQCWGYNAHGELGNGNTDNQWSFVNVVGLAGAKQLAAGNNHTCALLGDDTIKCWGANDWGQLGNGNIINQTKPVTVVE